MPPARKSNVLITGSLAYDHLYHYPGVFRNELHIENGKPLSRAFNVTDKKIHFGGCAGNIVYNSAFLGEPFQLVGIAGKDFDEYSTWLKENGIDTSSVIIDRREYTSQAHVMTDAQQEQLTIFHEGAAARSSEHRDKIEKIFFDARKTAAFALIGPNNKDFMNICLESCKKYGIPYFFDPGQSMPLFFKSELEKIIRNAQGVFLNEYEFSLLGKFLKASPRAVIGLCRLLVVTLGEKGVHIFWDGETLEIPTKRVKKPVDPTGCGDAFRAGFLAEIKRHYPKLAVEDLQRAGSIGTQLALACLTKVGTQNHKV